MPAISIVIPNFNGAAFIVDSLFAVEQAADNYQDDVEILVVDDASSDDSVESIARDCPRVRLLVREINGGFAEAVHSGVAAAKHDLIILLNSDVRPTADFIAPLVRTLEQPNVFSVSPLIRDEHGKLLDCSRTLIRLRHGMIKKIGPRVSEPSSGQESPPQLSLYASGGSMAFRRSLFDQLGGFLPCFKPFGKEDMDLGMRAWRRGWQTYLDPQSVIVHDRSTRTIKRHFSPGYIKTRQRKNHYLLNWIHLPVRYLVMAHLPRLLAEVLWGSLRLNFTYVLGLGLALRHLSEVLHARARLSKTPGHLSLRQVIDALAPDAYGAVPRGRTNRR